MLRTIQSTSRFLSLPFTRRTLLKQPYMLCIAVVCFIVWQPVKAQGQWTSPDANNNISSTNTGNVGIGTPTPGAKLEVVGASPGSGISIKSNDVVLNPGASLFFDGNYSYAGGSYIRPLGANTQGFFTSGTERMRIGANGNVGIGTANPLAALHVPTGTILFGQSYAAGAHLAVGRADAVYVGMVSASNFNDGSYPIFHARNYAPWGTATGEGIYNFLGKDANGNIVFSSDYAGNLSASGTITGGNIVAKYQDVAEWVPTNKKLAAATVVVLDSTQSNYVTASSRAYDTKVAGVVSAQPGITLGEAASNKVLVATTGRVKVKVDASRASIHVGDLLVTSNTEGIAMKSEPLSLGGVEIHRPGTLIGKALEPLDKGTGEILVLLSLQ